ncbi:protein IWS1 homolog 1 [Impatiens glandulifera]|uniref:protein IWS1 homolog 1 n=1 Tax=Impatiens glandulifera TaxID=253017 RepID=UPI001FB0B411|nr:protein IWS1 homolog 1 [Impatiens glandulifera]
MDDRYRDEDGEPLMDFDDEGVQSDQEQRVDHFNYREDTGLEGDVDLRRQDRSPTPVFDQSDSKSKPRKRLVKKDAARETSPDHGIANDYEDMGDFVRDESDYDARLSSGGAKRKKSENDYGGEGSRKRDKKEKFDKRERHGSDKGGTKFKVRKAGGRQREHDGDQEVNEMWQTIAGGDSEDDHDGKRTLDDDNFIDDAGLDPADRYGSDNERHSPSRYPQAEEGEEDDEIAQLFKVGKKKKKHEKSAAEISMLVENVMAELEVVAEEDVELNRQSKPAINKLRKLPLLQEVLSKKQLQAEFLDHGVLTLLKTWLEPLPDGSLPNINIREAVLKLLHDFPIDLEQFDRREQLKKSGLGKVIMFFSKSDEETTSNKRLAKELVDKWSRPIFNKSTRFEDMRGYEDERPPMRRPSAKKPMRKGSGMQSRDDDLDLAEVQGKDVGQSSSRLTTRPEAMSMDFIVRPQSKIDPDAIRARAKQVVHDQRRIKMQKKLQQLKAPKKKQLQATKLSVEGRGMVKYL